jgi:NCS2 family nucleobase:cation symporter-2
VVADRFFAQLPDVFVKFFSSGVLIGTVCAVLLNLLFNGVPPKKPAPELKDPRVAEQQPA